VDFSSYGMPDVELARHLLRTARVSSIPGSSFGKQGRGFLRYSFACSPETIRSGMSKVRAALAELPSALQPVG
jgi:bifunctional pyridoxal-dependent enzyme with beta-cystathionase and maltose regulon repressor activities